MDKSLKPCRKDTKINRPEWGLNKFLILFFQQVINLKMSIKSVLKISIKVFFTICLKNLK